VPGGKFIAINACCKKRKVSNLKNSTFYYKTLKIEK
jgi:hypothetical protein